MKLLVIKDLSGINYALEQKFKEEGYLYDLVKGYSEAKDKSALYEYDCILINSNKTDTDIYTFLEWQEEFNISKAVLILSPTPDLERKVKLLNLGADDVIQAPVEFSELEARIRAVIRRTKFQSGSKIYFANLVIELHTKKIFAWNTSVDLTKKEYEILLYLIANKDKVISRVAIAEYLWGEETDHMDSFNILTVHIKNIRKKMKQVKAEVEIRNSYGVGYQIIEL